MAKIKSTDIIKCGHGHGATRKLIHYSWKYDTTMSENCFAFSDKVKHALFMPGSTKYHSPIGWIQS